MDTFDPKRDELYEVLRFSTLELLGRTLWFGVFMSTLLAALITGSLAAMGVAFWVAGVISGKIAFGADIDRMIFFTLKIGGFYGFSWLFSSIVTFPLGFAWTLAGSRRTIRMDSGELIVAGRYREHRWPLSECTCFDRPTSVDSYGAYFPWAMPGLSICKRKKCFACGFDDRAWRLWRGYFALAGVEETHVPELRGLRLTIGLALGWLMGGCLGSCFGCIAQLLVGDQRWIAPTIFLGMIDGVFIAALYMVLTTAKKKRRKWLKMEASILVVALHFAAFGVLLGGFAGVLGMLVFGVANACVGLLAGLLVSRRKPSDHALQ